MKPIMVKINPEWKDLEAYESYLNAGGEEHRQNKAFLNWYSYYALKPLV
jgi:hypothetical protein